MTYTKKSKTIRQFDYTSTTAHGDRYKEKGAKRVAIVELRADSSQAKDLTDLIALANKLDMVLRWDFDNNQAYIEVVSAEEV